MNSNTLFEKFNDLYKTNVGSDYNKSFPETVMTYKEKLDELFKNPNAPHQGVFIHAWYNMLRNQLSICLWWEIYNFSLDPKERDDRKATTKAGQVETIFLKNTFVPEVK